MEANKFDLSLPAFFYPISNKRGKRKGAKLYVLHLDECPQQLYCANVFLSRRLPSICKLGMQVMENHTKNIIYWKESSFFYPCRFFCMQLKHFV